MLSPKQQILWNKTYIFLDRFLPMEIFSIELFLVLVNLSVLILVFFIAIRHFNNTHHSKNDLKNDSSNSKDNFSDKKLDRKDSVMTKRQNYVIDEYVEPSVNKWARKKKDFNVKGELAYVNIKLNKIYDDLYTTEDKLSREEFLSLSKEERLNYILVKRLKNLDSQISRYKKRYPKVKRNYQVDNEFSLKLSQVDRKLNNEIKGEKPLKEQFKLLKNHDLGKLPPFAHLELQRELTEVKEKLSQADSDEVSFLNKIKETIIPSDELEVQKLAIRLVKKISNQIEGDHPIPPLELDRVNDELKKIKEDLGLKIKN